VKAWVAIFLLLAPIAVIAERPDMTLLDTQKSRGLNGSSVSHTWRSRRVISSHKKGSQAVITIFTNPLGGIGLLIGEGSGGVVVRRVVTDSPAWRAGVREGDMIVAVDAQPTTKAALQDIALQLRGKLGTEVGLSLSRSSQPETFKVRLRRELVKPPADGFRF
jgi:S1-C subfamily serine protease